MMDTSLLENIIVGRVEPHIYAFTTNTIPNYLKVGDTYRPVSVRLDEWKRYYPELTKQYEDKAKVAEDVYFRDFAVHRFLEAQKRRIRLQPHDLGDYTYYSNEFFKDASVDDVKEAISDIASDYESKSNKYQFYNAESRLAETFTFARTESYSPRPNQDETIRAFKTAVDNGRTNLLMYAVMRFGKSFTSMCCAVEMNADFVVIVSAKADVLLEWKKTVESHVKFAEYDFITSADLQRDEKVILDKLSNGQKVVAFLTLQDLQGEAIKDKHQQVFGRQVDLLIIDETHFGARAAKYGAVLREKDVKEKGEKEETFTLKDVEDEIKAFSARIKLHLSGTPYRILMGSEFSKEDIIAFYQFTNIVKDQEAWDEENILSDDKREWDNPYFGFPQMVRFAFNPNESSRRRMEELRKSGSTFAFSALFKPKSIKRTDDGSHKKFVYEHEILDLLKIIDGSKEDSELLGFLDYNKIKEGKMCRHIVCVLPYCASCDALEALIQNNASKFKNLNGYEIINISGVDRPNEFKTPMAIKTRIRECEATEKKTITLTVNRMLTGSTVEQWDTMFFLKDTASPQDYDQAIFRLQNQYIKTYVDDSGQTIKYNMKPQTLPVDFDPNRVFLMQEQKAQIYNVNVDESGNSKLSERITEELRISPIIVLNKDKIEQVQATDILKAVSEYSRNRGVAEETQDIPVDLSLMGFEAIREAIEHENELGSKSGLSINGAEGKEQDMDTPEGDDEGNAPDTPSEPKTAATAEPADNTKDPAKQFRSYYARILFFAFLTKNRVISLGDVIGCMDAPENISIAHNIGIRKATPESIQSNADKFMLRALDYKIQNLNQLFHDTTLVGTDRAAVAVQKFGKLGESEVITPRNICNDMVDLLPEGGLRAALTSGHKILDIAGKAGELALALCDRYAKMGIAADSLRDTIYTIPTSGLTYEFTRMIYEILGLNTDCIAAKFTSYSLLSVKKEDLQEIDYDKIRLLLSQNKPFNEIKMTDEVTEGDEKMKFDVVVGNPPYQASVSTSKDNDSLGKQLFPAFIEMASTVTNKYCSLITPSRWFTGDAQDKSFVKLRSFLNEQNSIKTMFVFPSTAEVFDGVVIKGGINYFLSDKSYIGKTEFHTIKDGNESIEMRNMFEEGYDIVFRTEMASNTVKKAMANGFIPLYEITTGRNAFGIIGKPDSLKRQTSSTRTATSAIVHCKNGAVRYIEKSAVKKGIDIMHHYKAFISKSAGDPNTDLKVIGTPFFGDKGTVCTDTFFPIGCFDTEEQANNLCKYLRTKFARFLVNVLKASQNVTQIVYKFVPMQDFTVESDIDWNVPNEKIDKQLYAKYGLSEDETAFIEATIKPME